MVERSGYSVYFSDDLRSRVSDWADNSTSSQADIIDKALEDFFSSHEISDDGTIVSDQQNGGMNASNNDEQQELLEQIVENQEEMMGSLHSSSEKNGADIFSDDREDSDESGKRVPAKVEASDVEMQIKDLAGDYHHDDCIDPADLTTISISSSNVVKQTPDHLIPAVVAVLNDKSSDWVSKNDVENIIVNDLGMSMSTARNYREQMIQQGVLRPHPSVDDKFVGDEMMRKVQVKAVQASTGGVYEYSDINNTKRLPGDVGDYIAYYVDWDTDGAYIDEYCVDHEAYVEELWRIVAEAAESMAPKKGGTNRGQVGISDNERLAGAVMVTSQLVTHLGDVSGSDMRRVQELVVESSQCDEPEQYHEWMVKWDEARKAAKKELFDIDHDGDDSISEQEARDVLDVGEDASDGEIREAYRDYVMSEHPDADGSDSDMDVGEYQDVLDARRVLTE